MNRKTKIVATMGPATDASGVVERLIRAGVDVFRINFSHGKAEDHAERIRADVARALQALGPEGAEGAMLDAARWLEGTADRAEGRKRRRDAEAAAEVERVGRLLEDMFAHALGVEDPDERQRDTFHLIADVWMANLVAWVTHRASATEVQKRLSVAVDLLIKD